MATNNNLPPLPPGATLDVTPAAPLSAAPSLPPLPPGATLDAAPAPINPATDFGGDTLQIYNPFGKNIDTHIPLPTTANNFLAGAGKATADLVRGGKQLVDTGLDYAAPRDKTLTSLVTGEPQTRLAQDQATEAEQRRLDQPLMSTGSGRVGNIIGGVVDTLPAMALSPAAGGAVIGALQPTATGESRLAHALTGAAIGKGTQVAGRVIGSLVKPSAEAVTASAATDAERARLAAAVGSSREAGYVVPPNLSNPTAVNQLVGQAVGAKNLTELATAKNQAITDKLARSEIGLTPDAPLTQGVLQGIRKQAGQAYTALRGAGSITPDGQYASEVQAVADRFKGVETAFPGTKPSPLLDEANSLLAKPNFDAGAAVTKASLLRDEAAAAGRQGNTALAAGYKQLATSLEDAVDRSLSANPETSGLVAGYRNARQLIAKTHSIGDSLNGETGHVNASALARSDDPLTGGLKQISDFASNFPKVAGLPEKSSSAGGHAGGLLMPFLAARELHEAGMPASVVASGAVAIPAARLLGPKLVLGNTRFIGQGAAVPTNSLIARALAGARNAVPAPATDALNAVATNPIAQRAALVTALQNRGKVNNNPGDASSQ